MPTKGTEQPSRGGNDSEFEGHVSGRRSDALDVQQLWHALRQNYRFVALTGLGVFLAVMCVTLLSRPSFRATGRLYLGELEEGSGKAAARAKSDIDISADSQGVVGSEIEIIQSRSLVAKAVLDSGLNVSIAALDRSSPRYGQWLVSGRDPALLDVGREELRSEGTTLTDEWAREQAYQLRFRNDGEYEVWRDGAFLGKGRLGEVTEVSGAKLRLLAGVERGPRSGSVYAILVRPLSEVIEGALVSLRVTSPRPTPQSPPVNVVTLEFASPSPRLAASFLDRLVVAYLSQRQSWKVEEASAAEAFVTKQLSQVQTSLDDVQKQLADYRTNNRVVVLDAEAKAMIEQIGKYEEQRVASRLEVAALGDVKRTLRNPNAPVGAFLMGEAQDSVLEGMANSLSAARQKLTDLESRFNEAAPDVRDQRAQVDSQLESIRNYVSSRAQRAQENLGTLDSIINQYEKKLKSVPGAELGMLQLSRQAEVYSRTYSFLLERQQQTAIIKASTLSKNRVLDAPQAPPLEDSPKLLLRLASLPLGLLLGVVIVLGRSLFSGTFQSEADARSLIGRLPVLATIPRRLRRKGERRGVAGPGSLDVVAGDFGSTFTEAFRTLRTKLYLARAGTGPQVLLVTSPNEGDGKTTCALSLATLLSADNKRVLVIDADLRCDGHPLAVAFQGARHPGLRQVLEGELEFEGAVRTIKLQSGAYDALGSGGVAPAELLSNPRLMELLRRAREQYDFVLIDAPSFPVVADALVLAPLVDSILSVLRVGNSTRSASFEHLGILSEAKPGHALVLNDVGASLPTFESRKASRKLRANSAPDGSLVPKRARALAWWATGALLVLALGAAAFWSRGTPPLGEATSLVRHAG